MERHEQRLTRRQVLGGVGAGLGAILLAACAQPQPTPQPPAPTPKPAEVKPAAPPPPPTPTPQPAAAKPVATAPPAPTQAPAPAQPAATKPPAAKGATQVRFSVWFDPNDQLVNEKIAEEFNKSQEKIQAIPEHWVGNYYQKLQTQLAGGVAPDIIYTQSWLWQPFMARGVIVELDALRQRDKWNQPWPDLELYNIQMKASGKTYVQPADVGTMVMFYAKDQFDKAGVKYPTDDWTYEEFVELSRKLTRTEGGTKYYGYQTWQWYNRMAPWMRMTGEMEWDSVYNPRKASWDQPGIISAWQFQVYDALNTFKVSPTPADMAGGANQIQSGNVAMKIEGPWMLYLMMGSQAKRVGGTPFDVVLMPKGKDGKRVHMGFVDGHYILKSSQNQDQAWEFLKYFGGEAGQKRVAEGGRQPNTPELNRKYWVETVQQKFNFKNADAFVKAFDTGVIHLVGEVTDAMLNAEAGLQAGIEAMVAGQKKATEVIPDVNKKIQKYLDDYWAKRK
ncbi:MAG: sugar ABC transporter substrate-binding protein [Chloroflexi bacterium]|nr:sugar ABC transporter substrate-binding protein [Chloroflexota bacterium]